MNERRSEHMLHVLRHVGAVDRERRNGRRFRAVEHPAYLSWTEDGRVQLTAGTLMDVSRSGMLMLADSAPTGPCRVHIRLAGPVSTRWVQAQVVEVRRFRLGPFQLRVRFEGTPPRDFLSAAIDQGYVLP